MTLEEALKIRSAELTARIYFRLRSLIPEMDEVTIQRMLQEEAESLDLEWFEKVKRERAPPQR